MCVSLNLLFVFWNRLTQEPTSIVGEFHCLVTDGEIFGIQTILWSEVTILRSEVSTMEPEVSTFPADELFSLQPEIQMPRENQDPGD